MSAHLPSFKDIIGEKIYGVTELNAEIAANLKNGIGSDFIWLEGEITDFSAHRNGNWYFSLRDEKSEIGAVCWKPAAIKIGFVPENGMKVLCRCQAGFYQRRGAAQVSVRHIEPKGAGAEAVALRQLLKKLESEGLFAPERKKPLPFLSRKIGIATSPQGAALADILKIIHDRFPNAAVTVSPARVQGTGAAGEIARAIGRFSAADADVLIVARGGGSDEDLSAFNTEAVARAVASCEVPVISAVGHETDITACDLAADRRAATPSEAAEIAVHRKSELIDALNRSAAHLRSGLSNAVFLAAAETRALSDALFRAAKNRAEKAALELAARRDRLRSLSPLKILERGYSVVCDASGVSVTDAASLKKGDEITIRFAKGTAKAQVKRRD